MPKPVSVFADFEYLMVHFPAMFSLFCFAVFVVPIWLVYHVGSDLEVVHWITSSSKAVIALPILYVVTHVVHHFTGRPNRLLVLACTVGSAVFLLLLGDYILMKSYTLINQLVADDCSTFASKAQVELEWQNAKTFYASCMNDMAAANGTTVNFEEAVNRYRIQSCPEYEQQLEVNPHWSYLQQVEERYGCAGWCGRGLPLWTFRSASGPCAAAAAQVLSEKVAWTMKQVVVYSIIVLGVVSVTLIGTGGSAMW